jgi:hypothetical protein
MRTHLPALWLPEKSHAVLSPSPLNEPVEDVPILEAVPLVETDTPLPIQPTRPLLAAPSPAQMREELEEMVLRDLLGPAGGDDEEVDEDRVRDRYLVGMLAPGKTQTIPEEHEPLADAETGGPDEGAEDEDTVQKASFNPASLGMSFSVDGKTTELLVSVRWGQYKRTESESSKTSHGKPKRIWKRTQRGAEGYRIQLKEGPIPFWQPESDGAMWQQRLHTFYAEEKRKNNPTTLDDLDQPRNRSWRPFQLAFILLNVPSLTDLHHPERSTDASALADLLWFPTGGGKTEAYLGLTAYTLAIRRLQKTVAGRSGMDGVAVIMRYTLRLLTLQQFQRASSLICACEMIRREDSRKWGKTPFRLGLWVGQRSTPNTTDDSAEANKQEHGMRGSLFGGIGSPRQLTNCPWCGSAIEGGKNIEVETYGRGKGRTFIYCSDAYGQCPFSKKQSYKEGLPVVVVDEEIYRLLPALLIATVDKFAQLPWKGETQMLFGQVDKYCSRHGFRSADLQDSDTHKKLGTMEAAKSVEHGPLRPPDLIIQDELHLISGPLGSLVGLYETVIDHLATWEVDGKQVRSKVIAATATIRRAEHQVAPTRSLAL